MSDSFDVLGSVCVGEGWSLVFPDNTFRIYVTKDGARIRRRKLALAGVVTFVHPYPLQSENEALRAAAAEISARGYNPFSGEGKTMLVACKERLWPSVPADVPILDDGDF